MKQARLLTVELLPGVNVSIPIGEPGVQSQPKPETTTNARVPERSTRDPIGVLAEAIWPHIRARLDDYLSGSQRQEDSSQYHDNTRRNRGKRKSGQPQLPLGSPKRY